MFGFLKLKGDVIRNDAILFEKEENWGPCPRYATCRQSTKLYYSGRLIQEGDTKQKRQLDKEIIDEIINKIEDTGVMNKDCSTLPVEDYGATYKINVNNQEKIIEFPGCEDELRGIEKLIPLDR